MTAREVLRLSLYTSGRCLDVVVDADTTPQALVEHVASDRHGAAVTCSGQRLHEHVALVGQGVQDGDVLHLGGTGPVSPDPAARTAPLAGDPPVRHGALAGAALALAGALSVATGLPDVRPEPAVAAGAALTVAVAAAAAPRTRVGAALRVFAASAAGAGVAVLLPRTDPSALAVTTGAVAAAVTAAVLLVDRQRPAPALPVQLVLAAVLAGVSGGAMLLGAPVPRQHQVAELAGRGAAREVSRPLLEVGPAHSLDHDQRTAAAHRRQVEPRVGAAGGRFRACRRQRGPGPGVVEGGGQVSLRAGGHQSSPPELVRAEQQEDQSDGEQRLSQAAEDDGGAA